MQSTGKLFARVARSARAWVYRLCVASALPTALPGQASFCDGPESAHTPSRDLYCVELVPAVGIRAGSGRVQLGRAPGLFTVDVTADGHLRYTPALTLSGLPLP